MDHAANDVLKPIVIQTLDPLTDHFLRLICQAKGRTTATTREALNSKSTPVIIDRGLPVRGLHNILSYLEDQYPDPPLCFETPDRRAIVHMAVDQIIEDLYTNDPDPQHPTLLALAEELTNKRFVMDRLSLIDLALVPVSPPGGLWDKHRNYVHEVLNL